MPEINLRLNISLDPNVADFEGVYKGDRNFYSTIGTIISSVSPFPVFVNVNYTCFSSNNCTIDGCKIAGY